jgi:hypothetical protein
MAARKMGRKTRTKLYDNKVKSGNESSDTVFTRAPCHDRQTASSR